MIRGEVTSWRGVGDDFRTALLADTGYRLPGDLAGTCEQDSCQARPRDSITLYWTIFGRASRGSTRRPRCHDSDAEKGDRKQPTAYIFEGL